MDTSANACWIASSNAHHYLSSPLDDKDRLKLTKESGPYSGIFKLDYLRNCELLGLVPHPALMGTVKCTTISDIEREKKKEEERREGKGGEGEEEEGLEGLEEKVTDHKHTLQTPAAAAPPVAPSSSSKGKGGNPKRASSAPDSKLTPSQRAAQDLADRLAALSPADQQPIKELVVRGWELDIGTAQALQMTMPHCKALHTLKFWNANLSARAITTLSEGLKHSNINKMFLDYNPLSVEKGDESGLIYSLLLAPSSPLQLLSLRGNLIPSSVCMELMRTLCSNKHLLVLDLWDNEVDDEAANDIARAIGLNSNLQSLNLGRNQLSDAGARTLAAAFQSQPILDKEEAKVLKKAGFKITVIKQRTFRDAAQNIKLLNLSQNYLGEEGLTAWRDVCAEQIKLVPSKGMIMVNGVEVEATTLVPGYAESQAAANAAAEKQREEQAAAAASSRLTMTGRKGARNALKDASPSASASPSGASTPLSSKPPSSSPAAAAAASLSSPDDLRYPGQLNSLTQLNLSGQFNPGISEELWWQLRYTPLVKFTLSEEEQWKEEGNMNGYAIELERARAEERRRQQEQEEEAEKVRLEQEAAAAAAAAAAETARLAAEQAADAEKKKARKERKGSSSSKGNKGDD